MAAPTSTNATAIYYPYCSKLVWCAGYWYLFYYDGTDIKYVRTSDPDITESTFGTATSVVTRIAKEFVAVSDGTAIHVAYCTTNSNPMYYNRATVGSGGTLTFGTPQTAASGTQLRVLSITITSDLHVVIAYYGDNRPRVVRNANTQDSGTWAGDANFPVAGGMQLSSTDSVDWYIKVVPLTAGKFYCVYVGSPNVQLKGKLWNGSTLGSEETCTDTTCSAQMRFDARAWGDEVWIVWNSGTGPYTTRLRRRDSAGTWATGLPYLGSSQTGVDYDNVPTLCIDDTTGDVYMFWMDYPSDGHVYYWRFDRLTASWVGSAVDWVTSVATPDDGQIMATANNMGDRVGVAWVTGSGSPYTVRTRSLVAPYGSGFGGPCAGMVFFGGMAVI